MNGEAQVQQGNAQNQEPSNWHDFSGGQSDESMRDDEGELHGSDTEFQGVTVAETVSVCNRFPQNPSLSFRHKGIDIASFSEETWTYNFDGLRFWPEGNK